ncbi:MAG TPA: hypothetical protein VJN18_16530 [Polyangiaceae bacterium]|nr:hypothetical protein [Polyangiaceae bacterium]
MQRRALLLGLSALSACGPKQLAAPPPAPSVTSASELIPADLDVVVRLDWRRMKDALGPIALSALSREVLAQSGSGQEAGELVVASLLAADQVYLGYRPSPLLMPLDRVLAVQGHFEPVTRAPTGFSGAVDLGGDFRYWDRKPGSAIERGSVARIYAYRDRVRAFVSEAELDAVERVLSGQGGDRRLTPPEEGTLSLSARTWLLARLSGRGELREMLDDAKTLSVVADLESDGVRVEVELTLANPDRAQNLAKAGQQVLSRLGERWGGAATLRAVGDRVVLSATLSRAQLAAALLCLHHPSAPGCAW